MFFNKDKEQLLEQNSSKNDQLLHQLLIRVDALDREVKTLLDELKVSPEQISTFLENRDNFTPENWETLQQERKALDEKLKCELDNIRNPSKVKKAQADRHVARHWLYVK
jgi:hypothetical protein